MTEVRRRFTGKAGFRGLFRHFPVTLLSTLLLLGVLFGWWQSGRFSERRLLYFGTKSAEVFSSSSLIRVSVVDGYIDPHGRPRGYRQPNARGKVTVRPLKPTLRIAPSIWELTFGYWHLALIIWISSLVAATLEWRGFQRRRNSSSRATGRN